MGRRNFLVEGLSGTGKTSVCKELLRRGHHAVNGDTDLAYRGDPGTGEPTDDAPSHWNHLWRVDQVRDLVADHRERFTFFCGGSRNLSSFVDLFDAVFVLELDVETLMRRLDQRPDDEFGGRPGERELVLRLHRDRAMAGLPTSGIPIDAGAPLARVVDEIVCRAESTDSRLRGDASG